MPPTLPPCRKCGACCVHSSEFVPVTFEDAKRLPESVIEPSTAAGQWDRVLRPPFVMRSDKVGRCVLLEGELGIEVSCRCYKDRPFVCRALHRGSHECCYMVGYHHLGRPW